MDDFVVRKAFRQEGRVASGRTLSGQRRKGWTLCVVKDGRREGCCCIGRDFVGSEKNRGKPTLSASKPSGKQATGKRALRASQNSWSDW